jgi:hypothetical protein
MKKIESITFTTLVLVSHAPGLRRVAKDLEVYINFEDKAQWHFKILEGFITDLRSGTHLINYFVPNCADAVYDIAVVLHDANYNVNSEGYHSLSKDESDELLKAMIDWGTEHAHTVEGVEGEKIKSLDVPKWKTSVMKWALSWFGDDHWVHYEDDKGKTHINQYVKPMIIK